jgi:hypothetical protein
MPNRSAARARQVFALAALAAACADPATAPDRVPPEATTRSAALDEHPDGDGGLARLARRAEHARLAQEIPGYGGLYVDDDGTLTAVIAPAAGGDGGPAAAPPPPSSDVEIAAKLQQLLAAQTAASPLPAGGGARSGPALAARSGASGAVAIEVGEYGILQLDEWQDRAAALHAIPGVVLTGVSERENRVVVGLERGAGAARTQRRVERRLAALGIPREAVLFYRMTAVQRRATLRDPNRPVTGGQRIAFIGGPAAGPAVQFGCTLGFAVRRPERSENFFVLNSHCSSSSGETEGTPYSLGFVADENVFGYEVLDPPYGSAGGHCPVGRACRLSDAALAEINGGVDVAFGTVARTTFSGTRVGSLELDPAGPRFTLVGEAPFPRAGQRLSRVGATTGWTTGTVVFTCVTLFPNNSVGGLVCQDIIAAASGPGDSGSPVFQQVGPTSAVLYGIMWGGGTFIQPDGTIEQFSAFSSMEQIRQELGAMQTVGGARPF